jgi:hypothetical protein
LPVKKIGLLMLTLAVCCSSGALPASADQLYIHNRPYKGTTTGSGLEIQAELGALTEALGLKLTPISDNWVVTKAGEAAALPEGETSSGNVYFQGKVIAKANGATAMVAVSAFAEATGSILMPNKALGTVDMNKSVARMADNAPAAKKWVAHNTEDYAPTSKYRIIAFDAVW